LEIVVVIINELRVNVFQIIGNIIN